MGVQGVVLEHQTNAAVLGGQLGDVVITEEDLTARGLLKSADHVQSGGLTAARGAQKSDQLTVGDLKGEVVDRHHLLARFLVTGGEDLGEILQYNFHVRIILPECCDLFSKN